MVAMFVPILKQLDKADPLRTGLVLSVPFAAVPTTESDYSASPLMSEDTEELQEVIGGDVDERVSISEALKKPERYFVDPETHEIWSCKLREKLFE